jgi:putative ABC transport system permease protein
MNWTLLLASSLKMMSRNKLRTFFMSLGVMLGVATLIAGRSFGAGAEATFMERVDRMFGPGTIMMFSPRLNTSDLEAIEAQLDQVVAWAPRFPVGESEVSYQDVNRQAAVFGHSEDGAFVWNRDVIEGRFFSSADMTGSARVALIGTRMSELMFGEQSPVGEEILIGSVPFEIVGVLEPVGIDPHGEDRDEDIFVPVTTAMSRLRNSEYIGSAKLVVENLELVDEDAARVADILREQHQITEGEQDDFAVFTSKFAGRNVKKAKRVFTLYTLIGAIIVLLVAAAVIASIMLVVVRGRWAEIGLRKALGATEQHIRLQFLAEAASVSLVSGVLGIGLGFGVANIAASRMQLPVSITLITVLLGLAAALVVGVLSGILPARKAAALDPVEALR